MSSVPNLFVDLYELTMAQVYAEQDMRGQATFELSVRGLPDGWDYLIAAGLERVVRYLETLRFDEDELAYLATLPQFNQAFIDRLRDFRFSADVWAPPEGTVVYPNEPLIQVVGPLIDGQLVETALINQLAFATMIASKAARVVDAAAGRSVIEFGGRRAHGSEAAIEAARAVHIAGFEATSSVEAGRRYGIPVVGTMAHSFVLAVGDESDAFGAYLERYPGTTLLVDTYDTSLGMEHAIAQAQRHGSGSLGAIRIDSGDREAESRRARDMLDAAGLGNVRIIVSGGLDEERVFALVTSDAPIDAFACGTAVVAAPDAAALDAAYKLVEYDGRPVAKRASGKPSLSHRKQVWRSERGDVVQPYDPPPPAAATPLLEPIMHRGRRAADAASDLGAMRERASRGRGKRTVTIDRALLHSN